jgi:uncharacterized membrane protein required for colicin V production
MSYKKKELAIFHPCVQPRFCGGFCIAHFISVLFFVLFVFVVWSEPCRWCLVSMLASSAVDSGFEPLNRIGGAMVSMLSSSAVDSGFKPLNRIGGALVSMLASRAVDSGFKPLNRIGGAMVSMRASSAVDSGFERLNRIGGAMVSMLASSAVDSGFDPRSDQPNTRNCFSTKHAALRRKSKDYLDQNPDNVSEWSDISTCGVLFQ